LVTERIKAFDLNETLTGKISYWKLSCAKASPQNSTATQANWKFMY
jgi:hypothetical protein